jgi:hypothetical protein
MAIDLNALEPAARERLLRVGRQYGSRDTLAQAEQTLTALGAHAAVSTAHGFNASYAAMLAEARPLLEQAGVGREDARSGKKETNLAFISALRAAKAKRARARSILSAVADVLGASVADSAGEGRARATLAQTLRRG